MSTETKKADVLGYLDALPEIFVTTAELIESLRLDGKPLRDCVVTNTQVRDAVAELIEANLEMDSATVACVAASRADDKAALSAAGLRHYEANKRRVAALACIGGAA
jgi:uncharacterized protein YigA (DUF484 family)